MLRLVVISAVAFCYSLSVAAEAEKRRCIIPEVPEHGSVQLFEEPKTGTLAFYSCDDISTLVGISITKCLSTGEWTFDPPKCLRSCSVPAVEDGEIGRYPRNSRFSRKQEFISFQVGELVKHNELAIIRCKDDYYPGNRTSGQQKEVTCNDGTWLEPLHCHPTRCHVDDLKFPGLMKERKTVYQNGEILEIKCDSRYQVINATERELRCVEGTWKGPLPPCVAASCVKPPPKINHGEPEVHSTFHGSFIKYTCEDPYILTKNYQVQCLFGEWKGQPPICEDIRCHVYNLKFPGLKKGKKRVYRNGEILKIQCDSRYQVINATKRELRCVQGAWKGPLPPCVAASCINPPPKINHGEPEVHSTFHGSIIKYSCEDLYMLTKNYQVQCLFGEWKGQPPKCEDNRCYVKNLQNSTYVDVIATDSATLSGHKLNVICKEGYSPSESPTCLKGKWNESSESPCKENDCIVPTILHGDVKENKTGDSYWSWKNFRYERDVKYIKINVGTILRYGSSVTLFCHNGYYFQGTSLRSSRITCIKGKWMPLPVCLPLGQKYIARTTTRKPYTTVLSVITEQSKTRTTSTQQLPEIAVTTTHGLTLKDCSVENLILSLPESVYPDMKTITDEFVTPGSEVQLTCWEDLILTGSFTKAFCNFHGKWEVPDVQCTPACRMIKDETSHLIVEPVKDYYRFGEFIVLSCPPGEILTSEIERMMCLGKTWSDTLPDCTRIDET